MIEVKKPADAIRAARSGEQALLLMGESDRWTSRKPSMLDELRPRQRARLYDRDAKRLEQTARELGNRIPRICGYGPTQHVFLWGWQVAKAQLRCKANVEKKR